MHTAISPDALRTAMFGTNILFLGNDGLMMCTDTPRIGCPGSNLMTLVTSSQDTAQPGLDVL